MINLTRAQREALKRVYDRGPIYRGETGALSSPAADSERPLSYREFRATVRPVFFEAAVMVPWCGMWLGIEPDGYTHS